MNTDRKHNYNKFVKILVKDLNKRPETKKIPKSAKEHIATEIWKELNHKVMQTHTKKSYLRGGQKGGKLSREEIDEYNEEYIKERNNNAKTQKYVQWLQLLSGGYTAVNILKSLSPYMLSLAGVG